MTQIPLLSGIRTTANADFAITYPINLEPVSMDQGLSKGYLRSSAGTSDFGSGPGIDRGGRVWNGLHFRVMGTKLVTVSASGVSAILGDVGGAGPVTFTRFDSYLAIRSSTNLFYWNGLTLVQVTDTDLGPCLDVVRLNTQLFSTDGQYIVAAQLADPTQVDPNKYGSAETDPDTITGLFVIRNEMFALGQYTIDVFSYTGGSGFPASLSQGATIPYGCVGAMAKTRFGQSFAFVGGGENEAIGVRIAGSGTAEKISTRTIDDALAAEPNPAGIVLERRVSRDEERLLIHLSSTTWCFFMNASQRSGEKVWTQLQSGQGMSKPYRPRNATFFNNQWTVGDTETSALAVLNDSTGMHFGEAVGWQFSTTLIYNAAKGFIIHTLELIGLPGRGQTTDEAVIFLSYTHDGQQWSMERENRIGRPNQRQKRMLWSPHKRARNYLGLKFRGDSSSLAGFAAIEAEIEALSA